MVYLGTKAETLARLENILEHGKVLPQVSFCVKEWHKASDRVLEIVKNKFEGKKLVVRSSALNEDCQKESKAGEYDSVLGVVTEDEITKAVEKVINSYHIGGGITGDDQILIQPMLESVDICGVAFTVEPNTGGNYYVINYDDITGSTSSITSGNAQKDKLLYVFKGKEFIRDTFISKLCKCLKELEILFMQPNLDIEFAMVGNELFILQVRSLHVNEKIASFEEQKKYMNDIYLKIESGNKENPFLFGQKPIYGIMPDWNPAEIIGIRPFPLALSLYKEIITDNIWAYQRDNYGYRNLRSFPLLIDFYGLPYIDTRVSFNSFIPAKLSEKTSIRLVNYYLKKLEKYPYLQDKIEFDIAFTCYTPDILKRMECLKEEGFNDNEITEVVETLRDMTNTIIDNKEGLWRKDYRKIHTLEKRYEKFINSDLDNVSKIYWLLEDCKRYGTLPFAGLARAGFIAVQLLKSLVNLQVLSEKEYQDFMGELNTISSTMKRDKEEMTIDAFITKYGHLRPGTYDICSKRYDEGKEIYFDWNKSEKEGAGRFITGQKNNALFKLSLEQMKKLKELLKSHGMADDILEFFDFIKTAIEGREYAKFVFTKSLSEAIRLFGELGKEYNIPIEDCAYADIKIISQLYASSMDPRDVLINSIHRGKEKYQITKSIILPPVISNADDIYYFHAMDTQPNYVTLKQATGEVYLMELKNQQRNLTDKIVLIESADPGYDWIFSYHIAGFITKYGGANSHMAIRANELQIPAAIGVGEKLYEKIKQAKMVQLDACNRRVNILK